MTILLVIGAAILLACLVALVVVAVLLATGHLEADPDSVCFFVGKVLICQPT